MISRVVDYLQASLWLSESAIIMKGLKPVSPVRFYKRGYLHPMGFRLYFGNPNSKKGMIVASGQTMQSLRNDQWLDAEVLDWVLSKGGIVSRLDLAVTESNEPENLRVEDVQTWYEKGLIESALLSGGAKTISGYQLDLSHNLETFYVGCIKKRGKKGIFRAYDKGLELGLGGELMTRLELELKRESANSTAKRLAETNDVAGNFRAKFNVRSEKFEKLMDADAVNIQRGAARQADEENETLMRRWDWLLQQVAPALKQAIETERKEGRGDARLYEFLVAAGMREDMLKAAFAYSAYADYTKNATKKKVSTLSLD